MKACTICKTKREVIDTIKAMREYEGWSEKTSYAKTAGEVVEDAFRVCIEQAPAGWNWNMVAKLAKYMVWKNDGAERAYLYC